MQRGRRPAKSSSGRVVYLLHEYFLQRIYYLREFILYIFLLALVNDTPALIWIITLRYCVLHQKIAAITLGNADVFAISHTISVSQCYGGPAEINSTRIFSNENIISQNLYLTYFFGRLWMLKETLPTLMATLPRPIHAWQGQEDWICLNVLC